MKKTLLSLLLLHSLAVGAQLQKVDYRYAPDWHASSICLPDDTCKTVVGPLGQLLYHFGGNKFYPYANERGFRTVVHFLADEHIRINQQKLYSARVPIVITEAEYAGVEVTQEAFATGLDYIRHKISTREGNREDIVLTTLINKSPQPRTLRPVLIVNSEYKVTVSGRVITVQNKEQLIVSEPVERVRQNLVEFKTVVELQPVTLRPGEEKRIVLMYDNGRTSRLAASFKAEADSLTSRIMDIRQETIDYWENKTDIPYGHITLPDKEIQNIVDASLRGIWQAREIINNSYSFQVGPTCYRGLWIVDGAFLLEAATLFDRGRQARDGIEYLLSFQQENGKFGKMTPDYWKENGIVLWTCVRHALLTQDKEWLRAVWPKLRKTIDFIGELRAMTYRNNIPLDDGLIPPGDIDGGLWGSKDRDEAEYTNIYWNLAGMKAMIQAAHWLGEKKDVRAWQQEYDDFYTTFQKAAHRDMRTDVFGNRFLPVSMDPKFHSLPQRAQWAFCQAIYPGQLFAKDDPVAVGTLDMLRTTLQQGVVMGTGWMIDGIWTYFAGFYGHAGLWMGDGKSASESLYAFANHASPLYAWREEQTPRDLTPRYWGEMPHNWGSAEFVRLAVHLLALDRGTEMHLLEGIPAEWLQPGMLTQLKEIATPFGKLSFTLQVEKDGKTASLQIDPLSDPSCSGIFVHLGAWGKSAGKDLLHLKAGVAHQLRIDLIN
jgi:hypothetical protein